MSEPRRLDAPSPTSAAVDRDGQIEALLVEGLDHYFEGRHEEAIHLWTRVLFLDRTHERARAYIDRARSALAERHRVADQMLHETGESLEQGDTDRARLLLTEAVNTAGDDERAADLRLRLERIELARVGAAAPTGRPVAVVDAVPMRPGWLFAHWPLALGALALTTAAAVALVGSLAGNGWLGLSEPPAVAIVLEPVETRAVPSGSEVAVIRAQTLFSRGRLAEALQVLDHAALGPEQREAADQLRSRIRQVLLALAADPSSEPQEAGTP